MRHACLQDARREASLHGAVYQTHGVSTKQAFSLSNDTRVILCRYFYESAHLILNQGCAQYARGWLAVLGMTPMATFDRTFV